VAVLVVKELVTLEVVQEAVVVVRVVLEPLQVLP
jgi:hypothetical protein